MNSYLIEPEIQPSSQVGETEGRPGPKPKRVKTHQERKADGAELGLAAAVAALRLSPVAKASAKKKPRAKAASKKVEAEAEKEEEEKVDPDLSGVSEEMSEEAGNSDEEISKTHREEEKNQPQPGTVRRKLPRKPSKANMKATADPKGKKGKGCKKGKGNMSKENAGQPGHGKEAWESPEQLPGQGVDELPLCGAQEDEGQWRHKQLQGEAQAHRAEAGYKVFG